MRNEWLKKPFMCTTCRKQLTHILQIRELSVFFAIFDMIAVIHETKITQVNPLWEFLTAILIHHPIARKLGHHTPIITSKWSHWGSHVTITILRDCYDLWPLNATCDWIKITPIHLARALCSERAVLHRIFSWLSTMAEAHGASDARNIIDSQQLDWWSTATCNEPGFSGNDKRVKELTEL